MPMRFSTLLGKAVRQVAVMRGGGSALPGLFVETIDPKFVSQTLDQLPEGVVIISGTNGKTTTTKMVVELLQSQGLKVFTNRTGSNFSRGVAAALLGEVDHKGQLDADIAVLEMDEAHAVPFVRSIAPRHSLLLNVMRDQLDRFGEIDTTAKMLQTVAENTTDNVVLNREDPRLAAIAEHVTTAKISYFGLSPDMRQHFPSDDDMRASRSAATASQAAPASVVLEAVNAESANFTVGERSVDTKLQLKGSYNIYNAAAALSLVTEIVGADIKFDKLSKALSQVTPAFGRGETIEIGGQPLELVLVKNPSGFRLSLESFVPEDHATMIAINDDYADGRDMSWLWDVDFYSLRQSGVDQISGRRAYDMALRLQYDEVEVAAVETDIALALQRFIAEHSQPKRIFCTYTAMLALRRELAKITNVENIS